MAAGDVLLDADGNVILDADGNVQISDGVGDDCCCGGCSCGLADAASAYAIDGYSDSYFADANFCDNAGGGATVWDGVFDKQWTTCEAGGSTVYAVNHGGPDLSIHGKILDTSQTGITWKPFGDTSPCWTLNIAGGSCLPIWEGTKAGGSTPNGTYTRTGGSDSRATVTLV